MPRRPIRAHERIGALNATLVLSTGEAREQGALPKADVYTASLLAREAVLTVDIPMAPVAPAQGVMVHEGLTPEALLAIVLDRFYAEQREGALRCRETSYAITHLEEALMWRRARQENLDERSPT